ncbi:MAG: hypothetical protein AAGJ84_12450 [Pseudomonadota bacterium]
MLGSITAGVVANTFYDILKPFGHETLFRKKHRSALRRISDGRGSKVPAELQTAIDDLTRFLGNVEGRYDTSAERLLDALRTDATIRALIEAIIIDHNVGAYHSYFHELYVRFFPAAATEETQEFFSLFVNSISISFEVRGTKPKRFEYDRIATKRIVQKLDQIEEALGNIQVEKIQEYGKSLRDYARSAARTYSSLLVPTVHGNQEVDISDIFIPSRISLAARTQSILAPRSRVAGRLDAKFTRDQFLEMIERGGRCLVLGDPGGGKSTLGQSICAEVCTQGHFLAVRIRLRDHAKSIRQSRWNIFDSLKTEIQLAGSTAEPTNDFISHHLGAGRLLIFFDGLDEITNAKERLYAASSIERFSENNPANPVIVTSRLIGFDNSMLSDYIRLIIRPFTDKDVRDYVTLYMKKLAKNRISNPNQLEPYVEKFVKQTATQARELRDNPLMLSLICGMYDDEKGNIPDNRSKIYEECAKLVYVRWDRERKIDSSTLQREDFFNLISDIASEVYPKEELQAGVSFDWLVERVQSLLTEIYDDPEKKSREFSETICAELAERTWVFIPTPDGSYEFAHRTFLEFFFARFLRDQNPDAQNLLGEHERELKSREWVLPIHLALQMAAAGGRRSSDRAAQELERIGILISEGKKDDTESTNLALFTSEALAYLPCAEAIFRRLVDFVLDELIDQKLSSSQEPIFTSVISIGNCTQDRRSFAASLLQAYFEDKVLSFTEGSLLFAIFLRDFHKETLVLRNLFASLSETVSTAQVLSKEANALALTRFVFQPETNLQTLVELGSNIFKEEVILGRTNEIVSGLFAILRGLAAETNGRNALYLFCETLASSLPLIVVKGAAEGSDQETYLDQVRILRGSDFDKDHDLLFSIMVLDVIEAALNVGYKRESVLRSYFSEYALMVLHASVTRECKKSWLENEDRIDFDTLELKSGKIHKSVKRKFLYRSARGNRIISTRGQ